MNNDFVERTLQQVRDLGKDLSERARESASITGHQTAQVVETAKAEAVKLMRAPQTRTELSEAPEGLEQVRTLLQTAGLAA